MTKKRYRVIKGGKEVLSRIPGEFAAIVTQKRWGRLDCFSGARAKKENRIFFARLQDALAYAREHGFRPCKNCKPLLS